MCNKTSSETIIRIDGKNIRVDSCMANLIEVLNDNGIGTIACCCGHGKYNMSIIINDGKSVFDLVSGKEISDKERDHIYEKDNDEFFYVPDAQKGRRIALSVRPTKWWRILNFLYGYRRGVT